jgi:hypothetical protein
LNDSYLFNYLLGDITLTQWKVIQPFKEGKKQFKRGDIIKRKPNWPNFNAMVSTGILDLIEDEQTKEICEVNDGNV